MKKWLSFLLILGLLTLSGCQKNQIEPPAGGEYDEQEKFNVTVDSSQAVEIAAGLLEGSLKRYRVQNEISADLIRNLTSYLYDPMAQCDCVSEYTIRVGDQQFGLSLGPESGHAATPGGQIDFDAKESKRLQKLMDQLIISENLIADEDAASDNGSIEPEEQKEPSGSEQSSSKMEGAILVEQERFGVKLKYQFDNEDSKALAKFIKSLTYDSEMCMCTGSYSITVGEERYNVAVAEGEDDCYIRIGGKQKNLTEAERDQVLAIFKRQLTSKNRLPGEEEQIRVWVKTEEAQYAFTGADTILLADLVDSLDFQETTDAYSAPMQIVFHGQLLWGDLSAKEPYLFNWEGKMAKLGDQLEELKAVLARNCREENLEEVTTNPEVYVVVYGEPSIQYRFKNEDSRKIVQWIENLRFIYGEKSECPCEATYRIYTDGYYYLSVQEDGSAHFYDKDRQRHIVISKEDAQQLAEWFTPYCVANNEVKYYG